MKTIREKETKGVNFKKVKKSKKLKKNS